MRGFQFWACLLVLVTLGRIAARGGEPEPINVLFLMTDEHHFDGLGCNGNPIVKTPHLDKLAAGGTRFTHMFCPVPYCSPSRAAIVTGCYPSSRGLGRNIDKQDDPLRLRDPVETYLHHLAARGYHCHQLGKWHLGDTAELSCFPDAAQDERQFHQLYRQRCRSAGDARFDAGPRPDEKKLVQDTYLNVAAVDGYHRWRQWLRDTKFHGQDLGALGRSRIKPEYQPESVLADYCISLLKRHRSEPFAITYSVSPPHPQYVVPSPYYDMYDPARLPLPATWNDRPAVWSTLLASRLGDYYGAAGFREFLRCYYGQVTMMDDCFGRILDGLDRLGLADHTLVIFTTDHGEMLGQHGMITKAMSSFYDDVMHIPLVMRLPGRMPAGKVCDASASSVDLAPTILDYVGAVPLAKAQGRSLRPFVDGAADDDRPAFGERDSLDTPRPPSRMIRTRQWKLSVLGSGATELFDLTHDPGETHNLADRPAYAGVVRDLAQKLRAHMRAVGDQGLAKLEPQLAKLSEGQ